MTSEKMVKFCSPLYTRTYNASPITHACIKCLCPLHTLAYNALPINFYTRMHTMPCPLHMRAYNAFPITRVHTMPSHYTRVHKHTRPEKNRHQKPYWMKNVCKYSGETVPLFFLVFLWLSSSPTLEYDWIPAERGSREREREREMR